MLKNNKCYLLDCGSEIFIWVGRATQLEDRKAASRAAEVKPQHLYCCITILFLSFYQSRIFQEFTINQSRPKMTRITQVIQGFETHSFKSNFESGPASTVTASGEEGRGKVAGTNLLLTSIITPFPFCCYSYNILCMLLALLK